MECRYFQSSDSHVFVNEVNQCKPFGCYHNHARQAPANIKNNGDHILNNNLNTYYLATSNGFTNNVQQNYEDIDTLIKQQYRDINEHVLSSKPKSKKSSISSCNVSPRSNVIVRQTGSPNSNSVPIMSSRQDRSNNYKNTDTGSKKMYNKPASNDVKSNEKATYVRPIHNKFTEKFVHQTLQHNKRLQTIVKKLAMEREKEKRNRPREAWNNYINELKSKHGYYSSEPITIIPQYVSEEEELSELFYDCYNSRYNWQQNDRSQNLLDDFYHAHRNIQYNNDCNEYPCQYHITNPQQRSAPHENYYNCYPTSSQARLLMMRNRETLNNYLNSSHLKRHDNLHDKVIDKDTNELMTRLKCTKYSDTFTDNVISSKYAHVKLNQNKNNSYFDTVGVGTERVNKEQMYEEANKYSKIKQPEKSFDNLERKLDVLIDSVDVFITELRNNRLTNHAKNKNSQSICCMLSDMSVMTTTKSKNERFGKTCDIGTSACQLRESSTSKIDKIIQDEMEKSEKIKKDIDELLHTKCSVECDAIFDIPTKDNCTAVNSFSAETYVQNKRQNIGKTVKSEGKMMTIAVNTEPLGLLALLKVSAETLKQLLSYMPALNYSTYLSMLRRPMQLSVERYVCNVCGVLFQHAIQLSEHIQKHNFGKSRDCCVCRHVRRLQSNISDVFDCKYCGESFTRAYCRELHERSCCKRCGYEREAIDDNLLLLR